MSQIVKMSDRLLLHSASLFTAVASYDSETLDTVIPSGQTWTVRRFSGAAAQVPGTVVKLIWDPDGTPETLAATHGDMVLTLERELLGDGAKKLRLLLENDTGNIETIGAQWEAE